MNLFKKKYIDEEKNLDEYEFGRGKDALNEIQFSLDVKSIILADHLYNESVYKKVENSRPS